MEKIYSRYEKTDNGDFTRTYYDHEIPNYYESFEVDSASQALPWFEKYYGRNLGGNFSWGAQYYKTEVARQKMAASIEDITTTQKTKTAEVAATTDAENTNTHYHPVPEGQIWEPCEKCGHEPSYTPLHLCKKCWPI